MATGLELRLGVELGGGGSGVASLRCAHDAVLLATGAPRAARLGVLGEELPGVLPALSFLARLAADELAPDHFAGRVLAVIGAGDVAMDCARAALRLGARSVGVICLEPPDRLPAHPRELAAAMAEGVRFRHGCEVVRFVGDTALEAIELRGGTRVFADIAIVAIGQEPDQTILSQTPLDGVFFAGDLATGPRSVVEAVASGRDVALEIDRYLGGSGELELSLGPSDDGTLPRARSRKERNYLISTGYNAAADPTRRLPDRTTMSRAKTQSRQVIGPALCALAPLREPLREMARRGRSSLHRAPLPPANASGCLSCDLRLGYQSVPRPPSREPRLAMTEDSLDHVPERGGVVCFYDAAGELLDIVGGPDMRCEVEDRLDSERAAGFTFEASELYTQRQNELLSRYVEQHGGLPPGVDDDDLF